MPDCRAGEAARAVTSPATPLSGDSAGAGGDITAVRMANSHSSYDASPVGDVEHSMDSTTARVAAKRHLSDLTQLANPYRSVSSGRCSSLKYRDQGDDFVTRTLDFTGDVAEVRGWLQNQQADGGGDFPEAMDAALSEATELEWSGDSDTARVLILNADAPPHQSDIASTLDISRNLAEDGVRVYSLAASGVDRNAEFIMRAMAATTGGQHLFLTSDSGIGGEKLEPRAECYQVTGLDDLLYSVLATELAGERIEPNPTAVIRTVGQYDRGVCA